MNLKFVLIITAVVKGISMCNIRVCLTWTVQKNYLDLRCRVNFLIYTVEFTNNKREEQGFCIHPNPFPSCYTSNNDTIIMQNSTTNTTYLRIHGHIDSHYNGEWACIHGTNRDSATINVTVLQSVPRKGKLVTGDKQCWQSYLAYTMIGFFCTIFFCTCIYHFCRKKCTETKLKSFKKGCKKRMNFNKANTIKIIVVLCVICALFFIPVIKGAVDFNFCIDEEFYIIAGVVIAILFLLSITHEENATTTTTPDPDESEIPLPNN